MDKQSYITVQGDYGHGWEVVEDFPATDPQARDKADSLCSELNASEKLPHRVVNSRK